MLTRAHGGVTHEEGLRGGWCACGVGWISTTTGPIPTVPFGGANVGLGRETAGPNGGVARSKAFKHRPFFFFLTVNQEPFIVKLHDRMSKLDLRAKQPQPQT